MPTAAQHSPTSTHPLLRERVAGRPQDWCRDFAIVGGLTSGLTSLMASGLAPPHYYSIAAFVGTGTGAALGLCMPLLIDLVRRRLHLVLIIMLSPLLGALWGACTGGLAGLAYDVGFGILGLVAGGLAGLIQVGFFWFPYTFQSVRRARTWPIVAGSVVVVPLACVVSVAGTMALLVGGFWGF